MKTATNQIQSILLSERKDSIEILKQFLVKLRERANEVLLAYQALNIQSQISVDDIRGMTSGPASITAKIKEKLIAQMEDTKVGGLTIDKAKVIDLVKLPSLTSIEIASSELGELIESFESMTKQDTDFASLQRRWFDFLEMDGGTVQLDNEKIASIIESRFRVYASTEKQIELYEGVKQIVECLNEKVLAYIDPVVSNRSFGRASNFEGEIQYTLNYDHFFKKMVLWDQKESRFKLKIDFITQH